MYIYVYILPIHIYIRIYIYIYMYIRMYICVRINILLFICTYPYVYIHIHIYPYIHTLRYLVRESSWAPPVLMNYPGCDKRILTWGIGLDQLAFCRTAHFHTAACHTLESHELMSTSGPTEITEAAINVYSLGMWKTILCNKLKSV